MTLSEFKKSLYKVEELVVKLPGGRSVPAHFHVTEIGKINKHFIDCGGTIRNESIISLQLWVADDTDHRFTPEKLLRVINLSEDKLGIEDNSVEVEYQGNTIGRYDLNFEKGVYYLSNKSTNCLAKSSCVPEQSNTEKTKITESQNQNTSCIPHSGCC